MIVLNSLFSPISIAFIVISIGYYIGRIKIFKVSLNLSAVLIVAVVSGWLLNSVTFCKAMVDISEFHADMKFFSAFGTALFVSSIGLSTGAILDVRKRKDIKALIIGSLMVISAFITMEIISKFDDNITHSKLLGSLCGALTTTPGLSAACELENIVSKDVVLGYGCTYLFGVIATVLFVQMSIRRLSVANEENNTVFNNCYNNSALSGLIQIGFAVILGRLIGCIRVFGFSLGNSGGMLCSGIVIGLVVKKAFSEKLLTAKKLSPFRNMGLVLFFVGNGIPAGMQLSEGVDLKMIIYGVLMTIIPITVGTFFYKLFFNDKLVAKTIAGGMTSTPAIAVLVEKYGDISLSKYALAYFGALITIVILIRVNVIGIF